MTTKDKINYNRLVCVFSMALLACFGINLLVVSLLNKPPKIALKMQIIDALIYLICALAFAMFYHFISTDHKNRKQ